MFCFGGRRKNLQLQLPFIRRILKQYPQVEYHLWNLARIPEDEAYIRSLPVGDRFRVINAFAGENPWERFNDVYRDYANDEAYRDHLFVKLDDDVVFIETDRFGEFLRSVESQPEAIVSANVINNGACTVINHDLYKAWRGDMGRRVPLLGVHLYPRFALLSHGHFLGGWPSYMNNTPELIPTTDWLSINLIGYTAHMANRLASMLETPSPKVIAGRKFSASATIGDEGGVNLLPRFIQRGFMAAHLTFGPQDRKMLSTDLADLRGRYLDVGEKYLEITCS